MISMPFGCHKGKPLSDLTDNYLLWLIDWPPLRDPLRSHVEAEIAARRAYCRQSPSTHSRRRWPPPSPDQIAAAAARLVEGTPASALFGQVAQLLVATEVAAWEPMDLETRRDLESLASRLQVVRSSLIDMGLTCKRLTARRGSVVAAEATSTAYAAAG